jgi:L-fucose isomerase-like protein
VKKPRIAFLPIVRTTFDVPLAEEMIRAARENLTSAGLDLVGPEHFITDLPTAKQIATKLSSDSIDLLLIFQATFADSTMVVELAETLDAPVFLWAVPEPWSGGRLRLNSLCGINVAAHALTLLKMKYDFAYALPQDVELIEQIRTLALGGLLRRKLKTARLGVVGEHPAGMDTCNLDEPKLGELFGIQIQRIKLDDVFDRARAVNKTTIDQTRALIDSHLDNLSSLEQVPLNNTLSVYNALKEIAVEQKLDGLAVRCWPEFFTQMGCAACGAMSMLSDGLGLDAALPCSCEADINGTLTQLMLQILADAPAFGTDIVGVDLAQDLIALWHCGLAPLSMADPSLPAHGGVHSNRGLPLVMDFQLKPGPITFARISQATGNISLVLGKGEMLSLPKPFSGTSGTMRPGGTTTKFLEVLMCSGLEHHISLVYGDYLAELQAFAHQVGISVLTI